MRRTHIGSDVGVILICPAPVNPENPTFVAVCGRNGKQFKSRGNDCGTRAKTTTNLVPQTAGMRKEHPNAPQRFDSVQQRTNTHE